MIPTEAICNFPMPLCSLSIVWARGGYFIRALSNDYEGRERYCNMIGKMNFLDGIEYTILHEVAEIPFLISDLSLRVALLKVGDV